MSDPNQIGLFEVKTRFSEVVERVLREQRAITVTRRGQPVVDIVPTRVGRTDHMSRTEALAALQELRDEIGPMAVTYDEIRDALDEGRR